MVDAGNDPVTGKRRQITATCATKRAAEDKLNSIISDLRAGIQVGHDATLGELLDAWFAVVRLAPSSRSDYRSAMKLIPDGLRAVPVWKVRPHDLDSLYVRLEGTGLGAARIRRVHNILSSAFAQAVKWQWVARNPVVDASPPPVPKPRVVAPTSQDVRVLLEAADGQLATFLKLSAHLGARRGEVCALQWSDFVIDPDTGTGSVLIERAWSDGGRDGGLVLKSTKTDRTRTIALGVNAVVSIKSWKAQCNAAALAVGAGLGPWVFAADPLHVVCIRPDRMTVLFEQLRTQCELPHVQLRQLLDQVERNIQSTIRYDPSKPARLPDIPKPAGKSAPAPVRLPSDIAAANEQYRKAPSGTLFIDDQGNQWRKP
jgi:integrase